MKFSAKQTLQLQRGSSIAMTLLACLLLQLAFSVFFWLPTHSVAMAARPSVDALALIGLALLGGWAAQLSSSGRRVASSARKVLLVLVPPLVLLSVLLGIAQGVAMREFGYNFMLAYHTSKVQALFGMMYDAQPGPVFVGIMVLLVSAVSVVVLSAALAVRRLWTVASQNPLQRRVLGLSVLAYALTFGLTLGVNRSMTVELASQFDEVVNREARLAAQAKTIEKKMRTVRSLALGADLRRPTVLVFVVESYGQILMEADKYAPFREAYLVDLEKRLTDSGYRMRSTVLRAPVFGGSSWLANATILCRMMVTTEKTYFSLMKAETPCLPAPFNDAGYHSVFAASNTTAIDEEYARRFPFETFLSRDDLGYKGPRMSWSYMPDQYVIDVVERRVLSNASERPRFVYYKMSSSHHPWDTIPPYIADWDRIGDGSIYKKAKGTSYPDNAFLGGEHYNEGYEDSIRYSLDTIAGYLESMPRDRDVLALVLGDHQPRRPVAIMDEDPWTVPLHVISRDAELIARFERQNYRPGLLSRLDKGMAPGLELLAAQLFRALNDVTVVETQVYE